MMEPNLPIDLVVVASREKQLVCRSVVCVWHAIPKIDCPQLIDQ